ncbi:MAG TPA: carboxypeptidase regulatory-like domain-containing protein [Terriglobales bacterium]|nr:carboxypeptidase regulatory-like domain-containing protein [Terriglobales bacterium]
MATLAPMAVSQSAPSASLHGTVRDQQAKPVADAIVILQAPGSAQIIKTRTDPQGSYTFSALRDGVYALRAEMPGYATATISSLFLGSNEEKMVDVTLARASSSLPAGSSQAPQFFDAPQFTVSGVTDTTSLGGHGSDAIVRTRDSLAKETASLEADDVSKPGWDIAHGPLREQAKRERDRLESLLVQHPKDGKLHHALADADEKLADPLSAVGEYQRAAELDPSEGNLFDWGAELLLHHAPEPAGDVFSKGNRLFPNSTRMLLGLGAAWFARGDIDRAVATICRASDLNRNDSLPYLFLGKIEIAETVPPAPVIEALHRFVTLQSGNAEANFYYAVGLWKLRKSAQDAAAVAALLRKAIELDPRFAPAYLQLGILHSAQGNESRAILDYQHALATATAGGGAASQMAASAIVASAIEAAIEVSVIEDAHYRLAQAYRRMGNEDKANTELQLYEKMARESGETMERERHEVRQFVYTLRDQPAAENR